ncbi:MAG: lipid-A-disaccharide synthase [Gemmatimonadota bacterium]
MTDTVLLLAGEASGDQHGGALAAELRRRRPDVSLVGTGGPAMEAEGVELVARLDELAVMGFAEVLPRLPFFRRLYREIEAIVDRPDTRLVVPIDYPGFNMRVARSAHRRGRRVLYYIPPKVWAWRPGRARVLAEITSRVASILPFEVEMLERAGVHAEYVGHPLLDRPDVHGDEDAFRDRWGLQPDRPLLALLPGSRMQEVSRHLGLFERAAGLVLAARPDVLPVVSRAPTLPETTFARASFPVVDDARGLLRHATAALVKSGTATLEAALEGTPAAVAYRTSSPTWLLASALLRTEYVSLPNLVAGAAVVPEYLQRAATPHALADALIPLLNPGSPEREEQLRGMATVRGRLGRPGAAGRVANMVVELMESDA